MKNYIFSWLLSKHSVSKLQWPFVYWFFISRPFVKMSRTPWHEKTESRSSSYLYHTQSFNPVRHEHHHFITGFREHARKTTIVLFGSVSMSQSVLAYQMTTWYGHKSAAEAERLIVEHWSHFTFFLQQHFGRIHTPAALQGVTGHGVYSFYPHCFSEGWWDTITPTCLWQSAVSILSHSLW